MMMTIKSDMPPKRRPGVLRGRRRAIGGTLLRIPAKMQLLLTNDEIASLKDFAHHIHAVFVVEVDDVGLAVFDFIKGGYFLRPRLNDGHAPVVVHGAHIQRLLAGFE